MRMRASSALGLLLALVTLAGCDLGSQCGGKACIKGFGKVVS